MTQSSLTKENFVPGTSRGSRRAATLLAQMSDLERGERIKALRRERHLTQEAVADLVGVTLRAYQEWEAGGGIQWGNAKRLAEALSVDPAFLMRGELPTPDLSAAPDQLDRIERLLANLVDRVDKLEQQPSPSGNEPAEPVSVEELLDELKAATRIAEQLLGRVGRDVGRRALQSRVATDRSRESQPTAA